LDAAEALDYVPNRLAQGLRNQKTYAIAAIFQDLRNPFFPEFGRGIQEVAEKYNYDLSVYQTDGIAAKERKILKDVERRHFDGVVCSFSHTGIDELLPLLKRNTPVALYTGSPHDLPTYPLDIVYTDSVGTGELAVRFLVEKGHHRIGLIMGGGPSGQARERGYRKVLSEHGIAVNDALIIATESARLGDNFLFEEGYRSMRTLLERRSGITAVFAVTDLLAVGAMKAAQDSGLRIPDDVAIISVDNTTIAHMVTPTLTTVDIFPFIAGRKSAELLFERIDGMGEGQTRNEEVGYELIVRESV
jgi:DNA-binding LacI/PurR family transcriptional regulator